MCVKRLKQEALNRSVAAAEQHELRFVLQVVVDTRLEGLLWRCGCSTHSGRYDFGGGLEESPCLCEGAWEWRTPFLPRMSIVQAGDRALWVDDRTLGMEEYHVSG